MPIIYLSHPVHGRKIASLDAEAENDELNGWTRYNPDTPVEAAPAESEKPKRKYTKRVTEQSIEQPNEVPDFLTSVSDESEGN